MGICSGENLMSGFAYLFPGQGSQHVGMGKKLREDFPETGEIFDLADQVMDYPLSTLAFDGPEETLKETRYTQPAIMMVSLALLKLIEAQGWKPGIVAGHSLGEYTALVAARVLTVQDAFQAVKRRAELMFEAGVEKPGAMAAVMGLRADEVVQACREAEEVGIVQPANYNAPGQIVISGEVAAVEKAMALASERGARKVLPLPVSGAFHSELMGYASEGLQATLADIDFRDAEVPVVVNVDAVPVAAGDELRQALVRQLRGAVRWEQSIRRMGEEGFQKFFEIGPSRVLRGLTRKIDRSFDVRNIADGESYRNEVLTEGEA